MVPVVPPHVRVNVKLTAAVGPGATEGCSACMCITMNLEAAWAIKGLVANGTYVFARTAGWWAGRCGVFVNYVLRIIGQ